MRTVSICVHGPPPRKNRADRLAIDRRTNKPCRITSPRSTEWRSRLYTSYALSTEHDHRPIKSGRWRLDIEVFECEMRHLDIDVPHGDVDSCVSAVLDALQPKARARGRYLWGILDDDARVVSLSVSKFYDKELPRVVITMTEVDGG